MGCGTSKPLVETPDDVLRNCKVRRSHIYYAVKYRKDFAIAHAAYIHSLKDVGSALRHFALGEFVDADISPRPSHTPVLALPPPSTPSLGGLSPPPRSSFHASMLSPPLSVPRFDAHLNPPSSLPSTMPISPALSPIRLPTGNPLAFAQSPTVDRSPSPTESPPGSLHGMSPPVDTTDAPLPRLHSFNNMVSPGRGSESYYSPSRDDLDDALVDYSPPPPSSLLADSSWFNFDIFTAPLIPQHLQEQRRMKRVGDLEQEDIHRAVQAEEVDGIPDLEEVEHKEDEAAHDDKGALLKETTLEEVEKRVFLDETVDASELKAREGESRVPSSFKENPSVVPIIPTEMVAPENAGNEIPSKGPVAAIILKEKNLSEAMQHIDDLFARAFQCGRDVSRMLETQMHHHLRVNSMKENSKVFNAITSHLSRRTLSMSREDPEDNDLLECGMSGSHASTLERLYAWERKLNDEVKEGKQLRNSFDLKFKQLHNFDAKDGDQAVRDKLKASLKKLDTRLMVAIRAIRAASLRIQALTNEELYPQLCEMLDGLLSMWGRISECHHLQAAIALEMQTFEDSVSEIDCTEAQKKATVKLRHELENLKTHFQAWISSQKKYIVELDEWIKKCYDTQEPSNGSTKSGRRMSSEWTKKAPIFQLLRSWRNSYVALDKQQVVVNGIKSFVHVMRILEENQSNELKLKKQAEKSSRRLDQQTTFLNKLERQYSESSKYKPTNNLQGKRARLDKYKSQADLGKHEHSTAVQVRKDVTLDLLKQQLPTLFKSMSSFADDAKKMYEIVKKEAEAVDRSDKHLMWE